MFICYIFTRYKERMKKMMIDDDEIPTGSFHLADSSADASMLEQSY